MTQEELREKISELFFTILGDTRYVTTQVEYPHEVSQVELDKEVLHDNLSNEIIKLINQHVKEVIGEDEYLYNEKDQYDGEMVNDIVNAEKARQLKRAGI